jgi:hypothetical protein
VTLIAHDRPQPSNQEMSKMTLDISPKTNLPIDHERPPMPNVSESHHERHDEGVSTDRHAWFGGTTAVKFLLAGGIAGAGDCTPCSG